MKRAYLFIFLTVAACGCENILGPEPANTPASNFEIFWNDFDNSYAQFAIRNIDWDSVRGIVAPRISSQTTDRQMFTILSNLVLKLNDMHVTLYTPLGDVYAENASYGMYPSSKLINAGKYLIFGPAQNGVMEYRTCKGENIGYIAIRSFQGGDGLALSDDRYLVIDIILQQFRNTEGLLIDVRGNSGGNSVNAEAVAGRFADDERIYWMYRSKNGPGKSDFSTWIDVSVKPQGGYQYRKPVVVLTSRATCSSAELFVLAMKGFPQVTIVGDTTGGGVGNPILRELPNGWTYRLSTAIAATAEGYIIEGMGVPPDIAVQTSIADSLSGIDRIFERGIEVLLSARGG
jgi:carboxyl-terminal processing protease